MFLQFFNNFYQKLSWSHSLEDILEYTDTLFKSNEFL